MSDRDPRAKRYAGRGFVVRYSVERCLHAAECVQGLPEVFDPESRPWIDAEAADEDRIRRVVGRCPTGALWVEGTEGELLEQRPDPPSTVRIESDGPLVCYGPIEIRDGAGREIPAGFRVALCRCGRTGNGPFCDGSHEEADFRDGGRIREVQVRPGRDGADGEATLRITVTEGGPLVLEGPHELVDSDGARHRGGRSALCRCGASESKPFCDGSHSSSGFSGS